MVAPSLGVELNPVDVRDATSAPRCSSRRSVSKAYVAKKIAQAAISVPTATAHRLAETATPEPELEPHGLRSTSYGFTHWPPRALHPLLERVEQISPTRTGSTCPDRTPQSTARPPERFARRRHFAEPERPRRGPHPVGRIDVVFHEDGDAVERSPDAARAPLGVERVSDLERVGVRLQDRAERRVNV